jgi:hypothetical protein
VYCENDKQYFCTNCDELAHDGDDNDNANDGKTKILNLLRGEHNRVPIQNAQPHLFGFCTEHPKKENEYYDRVRNKAFCTICAIDMA